MSTTRREFLQSSIAAGAAMAMRGPHLFGDGGAPAGSGAPLNILILGGTQFLGVHCVEAAHARGHRVTIFNRGKTEARKGGLFQDIEVERLVGDRDPTKDEGLKALEGRKWDAVIDTSAYFPRVAKASAELLAPNVKQYIFISTVSVYKSNATPGMDESAELGTIEDPTIEQVTGESYGPLKVLCEKACEAALPGRTTVIRPGLIVGPDDPSDRFTYWPVRVARGGEVLAPGNPSDLVQIIDVRDLAEFCIRCIERATMGVFNAVGPAGGMPMETMLNACKEASASDATFTWVDAKFLESQQVEAWSHMPVWVPAEGEYAGFGQRSCAASVAAGMKFRPVVDTAKATLAWFRTLPEERQAKLKAGVTPEREAAVLAAWKAR